MSTSKLMRFLAALFAVALLAASCGSDDEETTTTEAEASEDDAPEATDAPEEEAMDDEDGEEEAMEDGEEEAMEDEDGDAMAADDSLDPVKIGLIAQDEELLAFPEVRAVSQAFVDYLNAEHAGIDGNPVELDVCGAGDAPEGHVSCAQQFVNDESVHLVITGGFLSNSIAATTVLGEAGKATLALGNDFADYFQPNSYIFDPGLPGLAQVFFVFAADQGVESMSLFIADDPAFEPFIPVLELIAETNGVTINEVVPLGFEPDLTGPVSAANPDNDSWLFVLGDAAQCTAASSGVSTVGYEGALYANDLCMGQDVVESGALDGWSGPVVSTAPTIDGQDIEEIGRILDTYGNDDVQTAGLAGWALANVLIAHDALGQAGGADATDASVIEVMNTYASDSLLGFPAVECGGPLASIWAGACNTSPLMVTVVDGAMTAPSGFTALDFSQLDFLLAE